MNALEKLLDEFNVSQTELSRRTGVSQPTINRFIHGKVASPRYDVMKRIANYFNVPVDYLYGDVTVTDAPAVEEQESHG